MITDTIAGIDIGGTKIGIVLGTVDGQLIFHQTIPTRLEVEPGRNLDLALRVIEGMRSQSNSRLVAVGIGCGGPLDLERGWVMSPPNLPGWDEFPIVALVKDKLRVPVALENDANAAALGEYTYGAGRPFRNIVYVTISTGIGGGIIIDGKLVRGVDSCAGEIGHLVVLPDGPLCGCGARGCLEAICSGKGIANRARDLLAKGQPSIINQMSDELGGVTAEMVSEAARQGDRLACAVWDETIHFLSLGVGSVITLLAPEAVILGGGVTTSGEQLFDPLRARIKQSVRMLSAEKVHILQAALGNNSGVHGALIIGQEALRQAQKQATS